MYIAREQKVPFNFKVDDNMGSAKFEIWRIQILTVFSFSRMQSHKPELVDFS